MKGNQICCRYIVYPYFILKHIVVTRLILINVPVLINTPLHLFHKKSLVAYVSSCSKASLDEVVP